MRRLAILIALLVLLGCGRATQPLPAAASVGDLFDYEATHSSPDPTVWNLIKSDGGNNCFLPSNVAESSAGMTLTLKSDGSGCTGIDSAVYSGAGVVASGFSFLYGRVDFSAKLGANGSHQTVWLIGHDCQSHFVHQYYNDATNCGAWSSGEDEIDIAEFYIGVAANTVSNQSDCVACGGTFTGCTSPAGLGFDPTAGLHTYSVDWEPASVTWYVDGQQTCTTTHSPTAPMTVLATENLGGGAAGANLPSTMTLASVHVTATSGTVPLLGHTSPGAYGFRADPNYLVGSKFTMGSTGETAAQLACYLSGTQSGGTFAAALYSDDAGSPGTLLASGTSDGTESLYLQPGWNVALLPGSTYPIASGTLPTLSASTAYWIVFNTAGTQPGVTNLAYDAGSAGQTVWTYEPDSQFPSTFPASRESTAGFQVSCYAIYGP